ncbi:hypothetical protein B0533_00655 [Sedimentibacter sp. SX930]|nr:hypothetical protein B0533_00655 [Sedimentibacter sp. SX930]
MILKEPRGCLECEAAPGFFVFFDCPVTFFLKGLWPAGALPPVNGAFAVVRSTFRWRPPMSEASPELRLKITEELR